MRLNFAQPSATVSNAKFDVNVRGEKPDFWPVSKFNTGSLPLGGNPAGNTHTKFDLLSALYSNGRKNFSYIGAHLHFLPLTTAAEFSLNLSAICLSAI